MRAMTPSMLIPEAETGISGDARIRDTFHTVSFNEDEIRRIRLLQFELRKKDLQEKNVEEMEREAKLMQEKQKLSESVHEVDKTKKRSMDRLDHAKRERKRLETDIEKVDRNVGESERKIQEQRKEIQKYEQTYDELRTVFEAFKVIDTFAAEYEAERQGSSFSVSKTMASIEALSIPQQGTVASMLCEYIKRRTQTVKSEMRDVEAKDVGIQIARRKFDEGKQIFEYRTYYF